MLIDLDKIPWETLQHAYGRASDTPVHLRNLLSDSAEVRDHASSELWDSIVHQGNVSEAAIYALPFLLELVGAEKVQGKVDILVIIKDIAFGGRWYERPQSFITQLAHSTTEYQQLTKTEQEWGQVIQYHLQNHLSTFLHLLEHKDDEVFELTAYLLTWYKNPAAHFQQQVVDLATSHPVETRQADLLFVLGRWNWAGLQPFFTQFFESSSSELVRLAAAIQIGQNQTNSPPTFITQFLVETVQKNNPELIQKVNNLGAAQDYWLMIGQLLAMAGPPHNTLCLPIFITEVENQTFCGHEKLEGLLTLAFWANGRVNINSPSEIQKRAVYAVAQKAFPKPMHYSGVGVLQKFGLPVKKADLDVYLGFPNDNFGGFYQAEQKARAEFWKQQRKNNLKKLFLTLVSRIKAVFRK